MQDLRRFLDNLTADDVNWDPWASVVLPEEYNLCKELTFKRILFEAPVGRYWYLGERVPHQVYGGLCSFVPNNPPKSMRSANLLGGSELETAFRGEAVDSHYQVDKDYNVYLQRYIMKALAAQCPDDTSSSPLAAPTAPENSPRTPTSCFTHSKAPDSRPVGTKFWSLPEWEVSKLNELGQATSVSLPRLPLVPNVPWMETAPTVELGEECYSMIHSLRAFIFNESSAAFEQRTRLMTEITRLRAIVKTQQASINSLEQCVENLRGHGVAGPSGSSFGESDENDEEKMDDEEMGDDGVGNHVGGDDEHMAAKDHGNDKTNDGGEGNTKVNGDGEVDASAAAQALEPASTFISTPVRRSKRLHR
ncbi:protein MAIN-LIKE 2-like [Fagus crenata]